MSFRGYIDPSSYNNSFDWNVVLAGTGSVKSTDTWGEDQMLWFKNHPNRSHDKALVLLAGDGTTQVGSLMPSGAAAFQGLTANKTVTIPAGSTTAQIQAYIDAEDKNLNGYTLQFRFSDGAYSSIGTITFTGFHGGQLSIIGNSADTSVSTTKSVDIQFTADSRLLITNCDSVAVLYLRFSAASHTAASSSIVSIANTQAAEFRYNAAVSAGTGIGQLIYTRTNANVRDTAFQSVARATVSSTSSFVNVRGCSYTSVGTECYSEAAIIISSSATTSYIKTQSGQIADTTGWL